MKKITGISILLKMYFFQKTVRVNTNTHVVYKK